MLFLNLVSNQNHFIESKTLKINGVKAGPGRRQSFKVSTL